MRSLRACVLALGLLATVAASAQSAISAQGGPRRAPAVATAVAEAAAGNQHVEALVLLDSGEIHAFEDSIALSSLPLHQLPAAEYGQRMEDRKILLDQMKATVKAAIVGADLEFLTEYSVLPILHVRLKSPLALARLSQHPSVLSIDENRANHPSLAESLPLIRQPMAAATGYRGAGTTVAVLDTGADYTRAAFGSCVAPGGACKVVYAQDFTPTDDGELDTGSFHGTNVSAAVLGVAPDAKIAALDVFRPDGLAYFSDIVAAINWSIAQKVTYNIAAINMSLGSGRYFSAITPSDSFGITVQTAVNAGIVVVAASGNDGYTNSISSPAAYSNIVSVGAVYDANVGAMSWTGCSDATTAADKVTCFSNSATFLTMLAPGALISAAGITMGGTSQASPHVAGAAAVLRAKYPGESAVTLSNKLKQGVPVLDMRNSITKPRLDLVLATTDTGNRMLTVIKNGNGTVTSNPPGINCGNDCGEEYPQGTSVTLTATPAGGAVLIGWDGDCSGSGSCVVSMTADRSVSASFGAMLGNGQSLTGLNGSLGTMQYYAVDVPTGAVNLVIQISGGTGDADLYVRFGNSPTLAAFDCRPFVLGNNETCTTATPAAGRYYIMLHAYSAYAGVTLQLSYVPEASDPDPDPFGFPQQPGVAPGSTVTSSAIIPIGYNVAAPISVANGSYSVGCTGVFFTNASTISPGQSVCVRHTAASTLSTTVTTTLTIGSVGGTFSSTTTSGLFRSYVASSGSDANPCTLGLPCRLLPAALAVVRDGGEVWMLDSANYNTGTINIGKSVSILAVPGVVGSVVALSGPALSISGSGLSIGLRNLVIVPLAGGGGTHGIVMSGESTLTVEDSLIANLPQNGIQLAGAGTLKVANSTLRNNAGAALQLLDGRVAVSATRILANGSGIVAAPIGAAAVSAAISDSVISDGTYGVRVHTNAGGATARIQVTRTTIERAQRALQADTNGSGTASVVASGSMIVHNNYAWYRDGIGATVSSLGDNHFTDNTTSFGTLSTTAPQ